MFSLVPASSVRSSPSWPTAITEASASANAPAMPRPKPRPAPTTTAVLVGDGSKAHVGHGSGDTGGPVRGDERDDLGHFLEARQAFAVGPLGNHGLELFASNSVGLGVDAEDLFDRAAAGHGLGPDAGHAYAVWREFDGEVPDQGFLGCHGQGHATHEGIG